MAHVVPMTEGQISIAPKARRTVRIHVTGGIVLDGNIVVPQTRSIADMLNDSSQFIEFQSAKGQKHYVSKLMVQTIQILDHPKTSSLAN